MTIKDILEGYGIDFNSLKFKMTVYPDDPEPMTAKEAKRRLEEDEITINGELIDDFDILDDYVELYTEYD